jgi:hypothetical protein
MSSSIVAFKDSALAAVGRTVVNFQRLEHNLKIAARLGPLEGVFAKVQRDLERRIDKASSFTLGQAIDAWLNSMKGEGPPVCPTPDLFDPTMRLEFSLVEDSESSATRAESLKRLLELRNRLIHGGLVNFQWESQVECDRLVEELTHLNEEIASQIDFVAAAVRSLRSDFAAINESIADDKSILATRLSRDSQE